MFDIEHRDVMNEPVDIRDSVRRRLRELRSERGLTAEQLAKRVQDLGGDLGRVAITKMESANPETRRKITVEHLWWLAAALNVSPIELVLPADDGAKRIALSEKAEASAKEMRAWCRGEGPMRWDIGTQWEYSARDREHAYNRAKPAGEYARWEASRHPAVRAARELLNECEALVVREADTFLYDIEPELGLDDLERSLQVTESYLATIRGSLEPVLEELRRRTATQADAERAD